MKKQTITIIGVALLVLIVISTLSFLLTPPVAVDNLQKFSNYNELKASFESARNQSYYGGGFPLLDMIGGVMTNVAAPEMAMDSGTSKARSDDFSTTNIQVEGVDEADVVKTDGSYAYVISGNKAFIVDAYPSENMNIVSTISLGENENPIELFITENKLLLFTNSGYYNYNNYYGSQEKCVGGSKCIPEFGYRGVVMAKTYDISDRANPVLVNNVELEGSYVSSRLIGNNAYFVVNAYPRYEPYWDGNNYVYDSNDPIIPLQRVNGVTSKIAEATEVRYIPGVPAQSFVTVAALNLESLNLNKEVVAASGQSVYASEGYLYLAEQIYNRPVPMPLFGTAFSGNWNNTEKTSIAKFKLDNGSVSFVAEGAVPGRILNQFSMDEYNGYFRIATTVENNSGWGFVEDAIEEQRSSNNIYVLGEDMNIVGALEDLAPNEKIYSARFMGAKAYLVTFKYVDPLFVIDLSNPQNPGVLGKLKIPGYSDYLHPIDETHLLGIGRDVNELEDQEKVHSTGAVYYTAVKGIKLAIFDVSDVANPKEIYKTVIGGRGTDSEALSEHRAILFDKEKELLVFPITISEEAEENNGYIGSIQTFQGAIVYNVSIDSGFSERGRITHVSDEDELKRGYYFGSNTRIRRSFYISDNLYTFSDGMLKANDLSSLADISSINFPVTDNYYGYPEEVMIK